MNIETFQHQFNEFIERLNYLEQENEKLTLALSNATTSFNFFQDVDGAFMDKGPAQVLIDDYIKDNQGAKNAFFTDASKLLDVIYAGAAHPPATCDLVQVILGKKSPTEKTLIIVGANRSPLAHVYFNNQVLENVWPDIAAGNPGNFHVGTILETK